MLRTTLIALASALVLYAALCFGGGRTHRSRVAQATKQLRDQAPGQTAVVSHPTIEQADLPPIVKAYLKRALLDGATIPRFVTLAQTGVFRMKPNAGFMEMKARQQFSVQAPGLVWEARMTMVPGLPIFVQDSLLDGHGAFIGRVMGLVPVASGTGPDVDEATLIRYLSETIWLPYALLPGPNLRWEAVGERAARAHLSYGGRTVSGVFTFDDMGRPVSFDAERPRDVDGRAVRTPWHVVMTSHRSMGLVEIPASGTVSWLLPNGSFEYGRFEVIELGFENP